MNVSLGFVKRGMDADVDETASEQWANDSLLSLAQWSRQSLSVLSKRRGPKKGGMQKTDRP